MHSLPRALRKHPHATNRRARVIVQRRKRMSEAIKGHLADAQHEKDLREYKEFKLQQAKRNWISRFFHFIAYHLYPSTELFQQRGRPFTTARELFVRSGAGWPEDIIRRIVNEKGSCKIFEIGHGNGTSLKTLTNMTGLGNIASKIHLSGIDVIRTPKEKERIEFKRANAIRFAFPKSDIIYSVWSLGYMGNIGHLLRKTAEALHSHGIAVLHINAEGINHQTKME